MNSYEYNVTILDGEGNVLSINTEVYRAACEEDARDIAHIEAENKVEEMDGGDYDITLVDAF